MKKNRYKYVLKGVHGKNKEWTGIFETKEAALKWFDEWGDFWKEQKRDLELVKVGKNDIERF